MSSPFPSFLELRAFITMKPRATICEIRDHFNQVGDNIVETIIDRKKYVVAHSINGKFYNYLQDFMKEDDVIVEEDMIASLISDKTRYKGPVSFLPIILSIKNRF